MERNKGFSLGHEEEWNEVVRKKKRITQKGGGRVDVATSMSKVSYNDTCSFFFSNFPNTHGAKEMLKAFKLYGEAVEVVIPPKRDKVGKRFGFVRFCNVTDPRVFAVKLDNIIFGSTKIHVNIPRFQREKSYSDKLRFHKREVAVKQLRQPVNAQHMKAVWRRKEDVVEGGSKKEGGSRLGAWRHGNARNRLFPNIVTQKESNTTEVCLSVGEEDMKKFSNMFVATVRTPGTTYSAQEWFSMQGFFMIKVTPLGARKVLLQELEEGVMSELLKDYKDWLDEKFDDIRGWEPRDIDKERVVWVRCHGIPVHAWNEEFFASLAKKFGEYLGVDEATRSKSSMDIARLQLRSTRFDVFNTVITANINGVLFPIKMVEEWCGPLRWIDNNCCRKRKNMDESSDSDDDLEGGPPLFGMEDDCYDNFEEDGEGSGSETEGTGNEEFEEVSFVQDSLVMCEAKRMTNEGNDDFCPDVSPIGCDQTLLVPSKPIEVVENVVCESTHVSNSRGDVGAHTETSVEVEEGNPGDKTVGVSNAGVDGKKNKIVKSKNSSTAQQNAIPTPSVTSTADNSVSHTSSSFLRCGVVRNPLSRFQPSSSGSISDTAAAPPSQVESIGDSGIVMGNNRFEKALEASKAEKIWNLAKDKLGVSIVGDDDGVYVEKIMAMEVRDKIAKGRKGKTQGSQ